MKPKDKEHTPILEAILTQAMTEEELYESYFRKEFWSVEEFTCLMVGITPKRYQDVLEGRVPSSSTDLKKCSKVNNLAKDLIKIAKEKPRERFLQLNSNLSMTAWKFMRLAAMNEILVHYGFFKHLPLYLMEVYLEFQPINPILRNKSKFSMMYHRALYKHEVKRLLEDNPNLMPKEIYSHPHMKEVRKSFLNHHEEYPKYKNRTIKDWIAKVTNSPIGRPKTQAK